MKIRQRLYHEAFFLCDIGSGKLFLAQTECSLAVEVHPISTHRNTCDFHHCPPEQADTQY